MVNRPLKTEEPKKPAIFLGLATFFVVAAVLGYVYEDELYIHRPYTDITFHSVNVYFIGILMVSLIGAFFCLFAYLNPRIGNRILGRGGPKQTGASGKTTTISYNVFADSTPSSVKAQHRARKKARHERHKFRKTPVRKPKKDP